MKRHAPLRALAVSCFIALASNAITSTAAYAYYNNYKQQPDEADLHNHGHYVNRDGNIVHSPSRSRSGAVPEGATAQCRDGSYSFSRHHSGTCSRHGGVARWQ